MAASCHSGQLHLGLQGRPQYGKSSPLPHLSLSQALDPSTAKQLKVSLAQEYTPL